jgi:hypothetical protein
MNRPKMVRGKLSPLVVMCAALVLSACDDSNSRSTPNPSPPAAQSYSVNGNLSGLNAGQTVVLYDNDADSVALSADGTFKFGTQIVANGSYSVTVAKQPTGQFCTVSSGSGAGMTSDVATVAVSCSTQTYNISGNVSGLPSGTQLVLHNNGADALTVSHNNNFTFATPVSYDGSYTVTVDTQPAGSTCTVVNGSGSGVTANVSSAAVTCSANTYGVSGSVTGLASGAQVTLDDNGGDPVTVNANGAFAFGTPIAAGSGYLVTVGTQPAGQTCSVSGGQGAHVSAPVTSVVVTCSANTYAIGGNVGGLGAGHQVTLNNNGGDPVTVSADGAFAFPTHVAYDGSYHVAVGTQPVGQTCVVGSGDGTHVSAAISNVAVTCTTDTFTIHGAVSGLSGTLVLQNNSTDNLTINADGAFDFSTPVSYGTTYNVTVLTQPATQTCTVSNGSSIVTAPVTNVTVSCAATTYTVGGAISGLLGSVTLQDNGADNLSINSNGSFTFATPIADGGAYSVTVSSQPSNQTCTVTHASNSISGANVTNVAVACVSGASFTVPGNYSFTVPSGVTSLTIAAIGGGGGGGGYFGTSVGGHGGDGAQVNSTLSVSPGQVLSLVVGGGGGGGTNGPSTGGGGYYCGATGGGGGSTNIDAGTANQIIAGGGGGGGSCSSSAMDGGSAGGTGGAGGDGGSDGYSTPAGGGAGGIGGLGADDGMDQGSPGQNGNGGAGGGGASNGSSILGGSGGSSVGSGVGGDGSYMYGGGGRRRLRWWWHRNVFGPRFRCRRQHRTRRYDVCSCG